MESIWALGLMSGTSLDGIDAALLKTDGVTIQESGPGLMVPYDLPFREQLHSLLQNPTSSEIGQIEQELTDLHTEVIQTLIEQSGIKPDLIGFHGQTVYHKPRNLTTNAQTLQIGDGQRMATQLSIPVIYDFRRNDVENGGEGAPFVPIFHKALAEKLPKPLAILNIGGVSNVTLITEEGIYAGDTGPGGALVDDWMQRHTGQPFDKDGQTASKGQIQQSLINKWMEHSFFHQPLPKSLDRQTFYSCLEDCQNLTLADGAATLKAFTVEAIRYTLENHPCVEEILLTGGGRHSLYLRAQLSRYFKVKVTEDISWQGDLLEAQAFAFLAVRSLYNLPLSFPTTTGVSQPLTGGKIAYPVML